MKTAQILIVGDEILSGRTADTNSHFLAAKLSEKGIRTRSVVVLPDEVVVLAQWIDRNHSLSDFLFISGGIGGTPDDLTREAVARGLGVKLEKNKEAEMLLLKYYGERINEDRLSMAYLPEGCVLIKNQVTQAPGFKIKNIYVFAGIPKILYAMYAQIESELASSPHFEVELKLSIGEGEIAWIMRKLNAQYPLLELGSYPTLDEGVAYKTKIVFKSHDRSVVQEASKEFRALTKPGSIL